MKSKKKHNTIMIFIILLLVISIGYALLSTTLKINGTSSIKSNSWSVYWNTPTNKVAGGSTEVIKEAQLKAVNNTVDNTTVEYEVTLNEPGDYYEFTVDAVNAGTLDAMVTNILSVAKNGNTVVDLPSYIKYEITYLDGTPVRQYHMLAKKNGNTPTTETYKVRVEFLKSVTNAQLNGMTDDVTYSFEYSVTYSQANDYAYDRTYSNLEFIDSFSPSGPPYAIGDTVAVGDSATDYRDLTYGDNVQEPTFVGVELDQNRKIVKAYPCGVYNNELICIRAPYTESNYAFNKAFLPTIFGEYDEVAEKGCYEDTENEPYYVCLLDESTAIAYAATDMNNMGSWISINSYYAQVINGSNQIITPWY